MGERVGDGLRQRLAGETGGHRIDRLDQREGGEILLADDVVGVDHRRAAVEPLNRAGDVTRLADGERLLQVVALGMEEDETDLAGVVVGVDPIALEGPERSTPVFCNVDAGESCDVAMRYYRSELRNSGWLRPAQARPCLPLARA